MNGDEKISGTFLITNSAVFDTRFFYLSGRPSILSVNETLDVGYE